MCECFVTGHINWNACIALLAPCCFGLDKKCCQSCDSAWLPFICARCYLPHQLSLRARWPDPIAWKYRTEIRILGDFVYSLLRVTRRRQQGKKREKTRFLKKPSGALKKKSGRYDRKERKMRASVEGTGALVQILRVKQLPNRSVSWWLLQHVVHARKATLLLLHSIAQFSSGRVLCVVRRSKYLISPTWELSTSHVMNCFPWTGCGVVLRQVSAIACNHRRGLHLEWQWEAWVSLEFRLAYYGAKDTGSVWVKVHKKGIKSLGFAQRHWFSSRSTWRRLVLWFLIVQC